MIYKSRKHRRGTQVCCVSPVISSASKEATTRHGFSTLCLQDHEPGLRMSRGGEQEEFRKVQHESEFACGFSPV